MSRPRPKLRSRVAYRCKCVYATENEITLVLNWELSLVREVGSSSRSCCCWCYYCLQQCVLHAACTRMKIHLHVCIYLHTNTCMCVYVCVQIFKIYWEKNFVKRQFSFVALFFPYTCIHTHTHTWIAQLQLHRSPTAIIFVCMYVCAWKGEAHATTLYCNKMQVHFIAILSWSGQG